MSLQPGVQCGTRQVQPYCLPCQPLWTVLGQRHSQWHGVGGLPTSSILQHPLPVWLQTSLAGEGHFRDPRVKGKRGSPLYTQSSAEELSHRLAPDGGTWETPSSRLESPPAALRPDSRVVLGTVGRCMAGPHGEPAVCFPKVAKCSMSQHLE